VDAVVILASTESHNAMTSSGIVERAAIDEAEPGDATMTKQHAPATHLMEANAHMGLKSPGLLTFLVSFVVMMAVIFAKFFGAKIPGLNEHTEFAGMMVAYFMLAAGCFVRSL
jgi:hypothetical protein